MGSLLELISRASEQIQGQTRRSWVPLEAVSADSLWVAAIRDGPKLLKTSKRSFFMPVLLISGVPSSRYQVYQVLSMEKRNGIPRDAGAGKRRTQEWLSDQGIMLVLTKCRPSGSFTSAEQFHPKRQRDVLYNIRSEHFHCWNLTFAARAVCQPFFPDMCWVGLLLPHPVSSYLILVTSLSKKWLLRMGNGAMPSCPTTALQIRRNVLAHGCVVVGDLNSGEWFMVRFPPMMCWHCNLLKCGNTSIEFQNCSYRNLPFFVATCCKGKIHYSDHYTCIILLWTQRSWSSDLQLQIHFEVKMEAGSRMKTSNVWLQRPVVSMISCDLRVHFRHFDMRTFPQDGWKKKASNDQFTMLRSQVLWAKKSWTW